MKIQVEKIKYDFGILDTITKLEELAEAEGERLYMSTPQGKNWIKMTEDGKLDPKCGKARHKKLLWIPEGYGYPYVTQAMKQIDTLLKKTFPKIIYLSQVRENRLKNTETDEEVVSTDIALTGKTKHIYAADAHAIGILERIGPKLFIKFLPSADMLSGCKVDRLDGKTILICEKVGEGKFETHWEEIFPSIKKSK